MQAHKACCSRPGQAVTGPVAAMHSHPCRHVQVESEALMCVWQCAMCPCRSRAVMQTSLQTSAIVSGRRSAVSTCRWAEQCTTGTTGQACLLIGFKALQTDLVASTRTQSMDSRLSCCMGMGIASSSHGNDHTICQPSQKLHACVWLCSIRPSAQQCPLTFLQADVVCKRDQPNQEWRFCFQCGKLEPLELFDGRQR